ncbi:MAG: phosphoribosyl-AMP cyclohydrolase [Candidatus Omnitrophica bacterium]|nr:phosphoribosyl-AMP cyclohydrolase [Candidatus Omnitrophota bacterium]
MSWKEHLHFNETGLMPAVIQDYKNNDVLMVAYMNEEALQKTLDTGKVHFYSRSRKSLWLKGEKSGHFQVLKEMYVDCDMDCLLIKVEQKGDAACHTGYRSCFHRRVVNDDIKVVGKRIFDPNEVYKK